jgi:hypothetical protein
MIQILDKLVQIGGYYVLGLIHTILLEKDVGELTGELVRRLIEVQELRQGIG